MHRLNPNQHGLFGLSIAWGGGGIKTTGLLGCNIVIFHPNQPNMVSNESWNVYPPIKCLKTFLCFAVFLHLGPEVAEFELENFPGFGT